MTKYICAECGTCFSGRTNKNHQRRFCGQICYQEYRARNNIGATTRFKKGMNPWNAGKYVCLSPKTKFKAGRIPSNLDTVGTIKKRWFNKEQKHRNFIKVAHPNTWIPYARWLWEKHYGTVPVGSVVHHIDDDSCNDVIENLRLMTRAEHLLHHRPEFEDERRASAFEALSKNPDYAKLAEQRLLKVVQNTERM